MIEKIQDFLIPKIGNNLAYYICCFIYLLLIYIPLFLVGYIFEIIPFVIISSIVFNILRSYTYGFHCDTNEKCLYLTLCLIIIFGFISKTMSLSWSFFIAIISIRFIYENAPIKLTYEDKSLSWHRKKIILWIMIFLSASIVGLYFTQELLTKNILWSIVMVGVLLFKNKDEGV